MKKTLMAIFILTLASPLRAANDREIFGSYGLAPLSPLTKSSVDTSIGFLDPLTPELSLRYEYGFTKDKFGVDRIGTFYNYEGSQLRAKKTLEFTIHSLSIGAQQAISSNMVVWGSLLYAQAPGTLHVGRPLGVSESHQFTASYLNTQFGLGFRWKLGARFLLGLDLFVLPVFIWNDITISGDPATSKAYIYSYQPDITTPLEEIQTAKILRAVLGLSF